MVTLPTIPLVVITNLEEVDKILVNLGTKLPIEQKNRYGARVFSYLLSSNPKYTGEYLYMKIKKYISFRNNGFDNMIRIFKDMEQISQRVY